MFKMLYSRKFHISSHLFLFFPLSHFSLNITNYKKRKTKPSCGHLYHSLRQHSHKLKHQQPRKQQAVFWIFLTKTEDARIVPNVLLDGLHLLFKENLIKKPSLYILKPSYREIDKCFEESLEEVRFLRVYNQPSIVRMMNNKAIIEKEL